MADFYTDTLKRLLKEGVLTTDMRILVLCGGRLDREVLAGCGFGSVVISNLDTRLNGTEFAPFQWSFQDAEHLTFADNEFDFCIVHSGLHHCYSPHRALLEMYRVARVGLLVFEPRDGALVRLGVRLNVGQEYEVAAVFDNGMAFGGVGNSELPNYVYRWSPNEVRKAIKSFAPIGKHKFAFYYALRVPWSRLKLLRNKMYLAAVIAVLPVLKALSVVLPAFCNNFGFLVLKPRIPDDLFPWLVAPGGHVSLNREWLRGRYQKSVPPRGTGRTGTETGAGGGSGPTAYAESILPRRQRFGSTPLAAPLAAEQRRH
jgi:SAM-dependent methyltransferase